MTTQQLTQIDAAMDWLVDSGAQVVSSDPNLHGGFISWYDEDTKSAPYVYSEITGYALTMLFSLWKRTSDPRYLASAERAGDWFLTTAHAPTGGFRCLFPLAPSRFEYKRDQIYTFDCGVILSGMVNLYRATSKPKYLAASVRMADWLIHKAQIAPGTIAPVYNIAEDRFPISDNEWSLCPGSYHTKIAIGLLNLYDAIGDETYRRAAVQICDTALTFQQPSGRFVSFPSQGGTNSHPHCYSAEGLWVAGTYLKRDDYLKASADAIRWLLDQQSPDGYVPRHYQQGVPVYSERVDVLAQALRLGVLHRSAGRLSEAYDARMEQLLPVIVRNQSLSDDRRAFGAFYFGRQSNGEITRHANVWVTMFAIQALLLWSDYTDEIVRFQPFEMV